MPDTSVTLNNFIEFLDEGANLPPERRRKSAPPALEFDAHGFNWTKEELDDAARVAMDRLYLGSTELDEWMPNGQKLHQIERKVKREQKLIDEAVYEAMKARYR